MSDYSPEYDDPAIIIVRDLTGTKREYSTVERDLYRDRLTLYLEGGGRMVFNLRHCLYYEVKPKKEV